MDKVVAIIPSRSCSIRLPGKVYLPLGNSYLIEKVVDAVTCDGIDEVWVAVPYNDQPYLSWLSGMGIKVFTGHPTDVLDRVYQCARLTGATHIVRVTQDCPLLTSKIVELAVKSHLGGTHLYTITAMHPYDPFPDGFDVEIFTSDVLMEAYHHATGSEREHVTPWIKKKYGAHHVSSLGHRLHQWKDEKLSVDTPEDYQRVLKWYEENKTWHV